MSDFDRSEARGGQSPIYERSTMSQDRARSRSPGSGGGHLNSERHDGPDGRGRPRNFMDKAVASQYAASEAAKRSQKTCRVYVGNLSYDVKWNSLKDFMREAGNVVFSEILTLPNGMSKGCGIVEYSSSDEAQRAIKELSDKQLNGRPVFVREDREEEARYGSHPSMGRPPRGGFAPRGGFGGPPMRGGFGYGGGYGGGQAPPYGGGYPGHSGGGAAGAQLFVSNLPFEVGWQDLKDLFRAAGSIVRADINMGHDGRTKGTGIVAFDNPADAQNAIHMYNGFDWNGRVIEVRMDRFAGGPSPMGGRGGFAGGYRGGRGGYGGGFGGRGGYGGGYGASYGAAPYGGGYGGAPGGGYGGGPPSHPPPQPGQQIFVKNLPWSTSNEDLVELFQTTGKVDEAEILFEHGRSKGCGVVQFGTVEEAETAIAKFSNYVYGGRALDLEFNRHWRDFDSLRGGNLNSHGIPTGPAGMNNGGDINMQ